MVIIKCIYFDYRHIILLSLNIYVTFGLQMIGSFFQAHKFVLYGGFDNLNVLIYFQIQPVSRNSQLLGKLKQLLL